MTNKKKIPKIGGGYKLGKKLFYQEVSHRKLLTYCTKTNAAVVECARIASKIERELLKKTK